MELMKVPSVKSLRKEFGLSQKEMADLLGVSLKAIQSYEQGWRRVPPHIEQMLLLHAVLHRCSNLRKVPPCWKTVDCPATVRDVCPARHLAHPGFCWLVTGTLCRGERMGSWRAKRSRCLKCKVLRTLLERETRGASSDR